MAARYRLTWRNNTDTFEVSQGAPYELTLEGADLVNQVLADLRKNPVIYDITCNSVVTYDLTGLQARLTQAFETLH